MSFKGPMRIVSGVVIVLLLVSIPTRALETSTHILVARQAVEASRLASILRDQLGYRNELESMLNGRTVEEWVDVGSVFEDEGSVLRTVGRFYRHFHDPLKPWDSAGLTVAGLGDSESSVRWMQNRRQTLTGAAGGNWSWH